MISLTTATQLIVYIEKGIYTSGFIQPSELMIDDLQKACYVLKKICNILKNDIIYSKYTELVNQVNDLYVKYPKIKYPIEKKPKYTNIKYILNSNIYEDERNKEEELNKKVEQINKLKNIPKYTEYTNQIYKKIDIKSLNILDVLDHFSIKYKNTSNIHAVCNSIFTNEKTPSMHIYINQNSFYCYSSNKGGSSVDIVMNKLNTDFKNAIQYIENNFNINYL